MRVAITIGVLLFLLIAFHASTRGSELFFVSVRKGKAIVVRGRVPGSLLDAIVDVTKRAGIQRASIRAVRSASHARLVTSGVDERTEQRLRNVFGTFPMARLTSAPPPSARNIGQILGLAWLAWLFLDS